VLKEAIDDLARSGISAAAAEDAGIYTEPNAKEIYNDFRKLECMVIPYYDPETGDLMTFKRDGEELPFCRVRYMNPPMIRQGFGKKRKPMRYAQPQNSGVFPYFPMGTLVNWGEVLSDPRQPVVITEGEKKALAGCLSGMPTIGLGGVFNFLESGALLPALRRVKWRGRKVYICFDSDASTNPLILTAEARLAELLSLKMGAKVHLVRLTDAEDGGKQGIDDIIVNYGAEAWHHMLEQAQFMGKLDVEVSKLNERIAWIEQDGKVYDLKNGIYINKNDLISGSEYSTRTVIVPNAQDKTPKKISVAKTWLTHEHARRYKSTVFDPSTEEHTLYVDGEPMYNLWKGWTPEEGDVTPFLRLHEHIFRNCPPEIGDFALKVMAYKFQNPHLRVPVAIALIGMQGSGKSMWARVMGEAAGEYGVVINSSALLSDFNGWIEKAQVVVMDEAQPEHVAKGSEKFKGLVTEKSVLLNEKYRVARNIDIYPVFILTANDRRIGYHDGDDRRMLVVDCAGPHPDMERFYQPIADWLQYQGGALKVCNYLLNMDLKGWRPPAQPPMTQEKYLARVENMTPVQRLADTMQTADQNIVLLWLQQAVESARIAELSNDAAEAARGRETVDALMRMSVRPFYTPEELTMIFPMIAEQLHATKRLKGMTSGEISRQLRECGIRYLKCKDSERGFKVRGLDTNYLVIADLHDIPESMSQNEFERQMRNFPTLADLTQ
jgi:hypothetical protein